MDGERLTKIRRRAEATPAGWWHPVLGSGHNAMNAIAAEDAEGRSTFIAELYPNYIVEMPQGERVWQNRPALLDFLSHAREDVLALVDEVARLREAICAMANGPTRREPSLGFSPPIGFDEYIAWVDTVARAALAAPPPRDGARVERIRALGFAIPFTVTGERGQADRLTRDVIARYTETYGPPADEAQVRRACGLIPPGDGAGGGEAR